MDHGQRRRPGADRHGPAGGRPTRRAVPVGRLGTTDEVAALVAFLPRATPATSRARWWTSTADADRLSVAARRSAGGRSARPGRGSRPARRGRGVVPAGSAHMGRAAARAQGRGAIGVRPPARAHGRGATGRAPARAHGRAPACAHGRGATGGAQGCAVRRGAAPGAPLPPVARVPGHRGGRIRQARARGRIRVARGGPAARALREGRPRRPRAAARAVRKDRPCRAGRASA
jgi:hypothetical protein